MLHYPFHPAPPLAAADPITAWVRTILRGLLGVFGNWRALEAAHAMVFYNRVSAIHLRLERLLARFLAGKLQPAVPRVATSGQSAPEPSAPEPSAARQAYLLMPRKSGWLLDAGKHHAAYFTHQLHALLSTPEMAALLEAAPQAKRMLRPLCRALAVDLPWAVTPPRTPRPRQPRAPRPKPEPFRIPLPRGVITWARREKRLERAREELKRFRGLA